MVNELFISSSPCLSLWGETLMIAYNILNQVPQNKLDIAPYWIVK